MKKMYFKPLLLLLAVLMLTAAGCGEKTEKQTAPSDANKTAMTDEADEIVLGLNVDLSGGPIAIYGDLAKKGFEVAIDDINAAGGILGKQVRGVVLDDKGDKEISKQNMEKLISEEKALAVVGPANSENALYWLDLAQENEVTVIGTIATASEITTKYQDRPRNYMFGIRQLDLEQVRLLIAWMIKETNNGKIAIIHDSTPYGTKGLKDTTEVMQRWGKIPVLVQSFDRGATAEEHLETLKAAQEAGADAVVLYCYPDSVADILKADAQLPDYNPVYIGTAANTLGLNLLAGALAEKLIFPASLSTDYNENAKILTRKIVDKYGEEPFLLSAGAGSYDAVNIIRDAITKAGSTEKKAVRDALENLESFDGTQRVFTEPFSKKDHEMLTVTDLFLGKYDDEGKIVLLSDYPEDFEIR